MSPDPARSARVLDYAAKAIWLLMAWAGGSMVGQLILYARSTGAP